jgi:hypothetical protein
MSIFRDKRRMSPTGERTSAPPPASGVSHIAELAAAAAARNAEALVTPSPVRVSSAVRIRSEIRAGARPRAVELLRKAFRSIPQAELAVILDEQPQHLHRALSPECASKPFPAENFVLVAERRPQLGADVVRAYVTLLSADLIDALADDLRRMAREKRENEVGS